MRPFKLQPGSIHYEYWAPKIMGALIRAKLTHRPSGLFVEFQIGRAVDDSLTNGINQLSRLVRQGGH